jgi:phospholipase/carboxylesterase
MGKKNEPIRIEIRGWPFRVRKPGKNQENPEVLLLLHGHQGNEDVMWILTNPLPDHFWMLAPRAPVQTAQDGYSWHEIGQTWPDLEMYRTLTKELLSRVDDWMEENQVHPEKVHLMGFSQGAVMVYALGFLYPDRIGKMAAIAGFFPGDWRDALDQHAFQDKQIFIAHGTRDEIIPIEKARQAADVLEGAGAQVHFCSAETGHKLSANCFNGLGDFFK